MNENRSQLRRWITSALIVLLLHGGVVIAALKWHRAAPLEPLLIDLAPPAVPIPEHSNAQPTPGGEPAELPAPPEQIDANVTPQGPIKSANEPINAEIARNGGDNAEPSEATPLPQAPGPSEIVKLENGGGTSTASGGGGTLRAGQSAGHSSVVANSPAVSGRVVNDPAANNPVANGPMNSGPIDTSITVQPSLYGKRGLGAIDHRGALGVIGQKGGVALRPLAHLGEPEHSRGLNLPGVSAPGATGAHVQDRARAAMAKHINAVGIAETDIVGRGGMNAVGNVTTSAIGIAGTGITSKGATNAVGNIATATNAIGVAVRLPATVPATNLGARNTRPLSLAGSMPAAAIDGRTAIRPGSGAGVIGGPAPKTVNGVISGTNFHARVP